MNAWLWLMALGILLGAPESRAFVHARIGSVIENMEMKALAGGAQPLLSNATANVFIFFKPGQANSRRALASLAACQKELAGKSIRWVAVVSDRFSKLVVEKEVKAAGISMPILVDAADALYGRLGVVLCPVVGIADQDHKLAAYEPFRKVNFQEILRARIRFLLQEIDARELERVIKPPRATQNAQAEKRNQPGADRAIPGA
jgi:hypothetical protein